MINTSGCDLCLIKNLQISPLFGCKFPKELYLEGFWAHSKSLGFQTERLLIITTGSHFSSHWRKKGCLIPSFFRVSIQSVLLLSDSECVCAHAGFVSYATPPFFLSRASRVGDETKHPKFWTHERFVAVRTVSPCLNTGLGFYWMWAFSVGRIIIKHVNWDAQLTNHRNFNCLETRGFF